MTYKAGVKDTLTAVVNKEVTGVTYDFVTNFSTYASSWNNQYAEHTITSTDLGTYSMAASFTLSNACKQTGTITDKPVCAVKTGTHYITVTEVTSGDFSSITSFSVKLAQWTTKVFTDIHLEYSLDGTTWVSCSDVITTPGDLSSNVDIKNAVAFRVSYTAASEKNVQLGLASITLGN